jgi:hypothetical protein
MGGRSSKPALAEQEIREEQDPSDDDEYMSCDEGETDLLSIDVPPPLKVTVTPPPQTREVRDSRFPDGTPSPNRWRKSGLSIDVDAAAVKATVAENSPPLPILDPEKPRIQTPAVSPAATCYFSPVPAGYGKNLTTMTFDDLELALLGYSPATSVIRSAKNGNDPISPRALQAGTPRDARVLGNFGFKREPKPAVTERVIVVL